MYPKPPRRSRFANPVRIRPESQASPQVSLLFNAVDSRQDRSSGSSWRSGQFQLKTIPGCPFGKHVGHTVRTAERPGPQVGSIVPPGSLPSDRDRPSICPFSSKRIGADPSANGRCSSVEGRAEAERPTAGFPWR